MAELFKFRCYQCQKLIGAPPSRFGTIVKCPKCGVELIVPSPDTDPSAEVEVDPDAFRPEDLGITLAPEPLRRPAVDASPQPTPVGPDPIAFLSQLDRPADAPGSDAAPDDRDPVDSPGPEDAPDLIEPALEPLVARKRGRSGGVGASGRARDVVLPRTAVVAWALFALFALALAFLAGLLLGQRLAR